MDKAKIVRTNAKHLREHAAVLFKMPAGEQFIGARDAVLHAALCQIAEALECLAPPETGGGALGKVGE